LESGLCAASSANTGCPFPSADAVSSSLESRTHRTPLRTAVPGSTLLHPIPYVSVHVGPSRWSFFTYHNGNEPKDPPPALGIGKVRANYAGSATPLYIGDAKNILSGPIVGPKIGPIIHSAMAAPLLSAGIVSAMVPAPSAIGQDDAIPTRNRKAISAPRLFATAHAIVKITNRTLLTLYKIVRPYISESGAITSGPNAYPRR
jgi:hypothetical protein